jgi:hypothetical protein
MSDASTPENPAEEHGLPTALPAANAGRPSPRRGSVSRTIVNFWLDCSLLLAFVALCWVSSVLQFVFPAGANAGAYRIWGGTQLDWQNAQFSVLSVLALGIVLHVMLHWSWVMGVIATRMLGRKVARDTGAHTLIGAGLLLAILHVLALGCLAAWMSLEKRGAERPQVGLERNSTTTQFCGPGCNRLRPRLEPVALWCCVRGLEFVGFSAAGDAAPKQVPLPSG